MVTRSLPSAPNIDIETSGSFLSMSEITLLLDAVGRGNGLASEELLPLVYDELRHLAAARMAQQGAGQTLQPTALVHEAWLRLVGGENRNWKDRAHFYCVAAQAMRRILIDRARHKSSLKCGSNPTRMNIDDLELATTTPDDRIVLIDEALGRLEREDPVSARVVTLKFFGGFTNKEIAEILEMSERTVDRRWVYAKTRLFRMIEEPE
jgi:RNA polymerase sigma factor (TIGR02999 family)